MPPKRASKKAPKPKPKKRTSGAQALVTLLQDLDAGGGDTNRRVRSLAVRLESVGRHLLLALDALQRVETSIANLTAKMQGALVYKSPTPAERIDPPAPVPGLGTAQPFYEPTDTLIVSHGAEGTGEHVSTVLSRIANGGDA